MGASGKNFDNTLLQYQWTNGDLPLGVHKASLWETLTHFGRGTSQRKLGAARLERIYAVAAATGHLTRFIVFGSFITDKPAPNDVDVFMLMDDAFDFARLTGETRLLFDHASAQAHFGASVFWLRRLAAFEGEQKAVEYWQIKREGDFHGIVEIVPEAL